MTGGRSLEERRKRLTPAQQRALEMRLSTASTGDTAPERTGAAPGEPAPLSAQQRRYWALAQRDPRPDASIAVRFRGELRLPLLTGCLTALVARHEMLRVRYLSNVAGAVQQLVDPPYRARLELHDLAQADDPEAAALELIAERVTRPVDLSVARREFVCVSLAPAEHLLLVPMQHASVDGISVEVLLDELTVLYSAAARGERVDLPSNRWRYADYVAWQAEEARSAGQRRQLDYWCSRLAGVPLVLDLPTDRPRGAVRAPVGAEVRRTIGTALRERLAAFCAEQRATSFMVLLAALQVTVLRCTGTRRFVVGVATAGRTLPAIEPLFGCFINTLPIPADLSDPALDFAALVRSVRDDAVAAYDNQDVPVETILAALRRAGSPAADPLGQLRFDMRTFHRTHSLPGLRCELVTVVPPPPADLCVVVREDERQSSLALEYATDVFEPSTAHRLLGTFESVLSGGLADPTTPVHVLADVVQPAPRS